MKINKILKQKNKGMKENPDFEQNYYSKSSEGIFRTGHDSVRLMKWLDFYGRSCYENIIHYDIIFTVLIFLNETS